MGVIKVPFDTTGDIRNGQRPSAMDDTFSVRCKDLDAVLENAYETMNWFKYL